MMRTALLDIATCVIVATVCYAFATFVAWDGNPAHWAEGRFFVAMFATVFSIAACAGRRGL
jgi:hypothetical protein